ncbi:hypothetical protein evm_010955 [Chilo suppressalis]|nr:hypothetical protein evm_010955 [Chilo suppressalis]
MSVERSYHELFKTVSNGDHAVRRLLCLQWTVLEKIIVTAAQRFVESLTVNGTALSPGQEMWFSYSTHPFEVTEDSKSLSLNLRRCRLSYEKLNLFPIYKQSYCRMECEVKNVLKKCNCSMPIHPTPATTYCIPKLVSCAKNAIRQTNIENCKCISTCDTHLDSTKVTTYELSPNHVPIDSFYQDLYFENVTIVRVFIRTRAITKITRQAYFTTYDLFAQMGGIFNVFFGCSVLSLLELLQLIIYCLRNRRILKKPLKKGKTSLLCLNTNKSLKKAAVILNHPD